MFLVEVMWDRDGPFRPRLDGEGVLPYQQRIDRTHPALVLMILDQSSSMAGVLAGENLPKRQAVADAVNRIVYDLILRCVKNAAEGPRHYYDLGLISYGPSNEHTGSTAGPAWSGMLAGRTVVSSVEAAHNPRRVVSLPNEHGSQVRTPVWYEPVSDGTTPMCEALHLAGQTTAEWIQRHPGSFPPVLIHVTDGASTDGDPRVWAQRIQHLATTDGNVLLLNLSLSQDKNPSRFPDSRNALRTREAKELFDMSSVLPPFMLAAARASGLDVPDRGRGFVNNADIAAVVNFFQIGTATVHQMAG